MGTPLYMELKEAIDIVTNYGDLQGIEGFLEILTDMEACYDDLDKEDRTALNMVMRAGRAMFASGE
jgi:hypothetical protein